MLELADGSLFFNSTYADHRAISAPPEALRHILRMIEDSRPTLEAVADHITGTATPDAVGHIERLLLPLAKAGILVPLRTEQRPAWADDDLAERFSTQIEWLGTLSTTPHGHWDYFARLREASVAVIGLGGAGSLLALALAAAGIGRLTLVDGDTVEVSNLTRQILYSPNQAGLGKADCLAEQLEQFSPYTQYRVLREYVSSPEDVHKSIEGADFVAVCADAPRFTLNRWIDTACKRNAVPYIGAFAGSVGPMYRPDSPGCFGCFEERLREELGLRHDMVVDALAAKQSWRYPAFVSGPLTVAHLMTTEIVLHLTGAAKPSSAGGILRYQHPNTVVEPFPGHPACNCSTTSPTAPART
ncbi:ThiF family adenylyltransferase [Kitasatospora sp. DSM 101779]|uniref:ThiF family adenylyltransferase n=1 Tax=Kitasatospora sp. DSM 101779 TaxID=2853165 RepID=UPI0021DAAA93|nr:ThiF family adenylyltransferase [Kitasatospora sp. DSM 101779]MCU7827351.1 ThiF family adenylyltransferase [Kitasatospora sp. DSM 101779]